MIWCVVGGQYGSEGKGAFVAWLARRYRFQVAVRAGGPQAGHTFWKDGKRVCRQVPVGCVVSPECWGYIGPGAIIDPEVINHEVEEFSLRGRLWVHPNATLVERAHRAREESLADKGWIPGSTMEGVGAARAERALRQGVRASDFDAPWVDRDLRWYDEMLRESESESRSVLVEGAQGFGLSLFHGSYPYVTSADTTPAAVLSECGLSHRANLVTAVVRTFPIRVGGSSGPLPQEISWEMLGRPPEYTTVTGRMRRIAAFDWGEFGRMLRIVRPDHVALMFADYLDERIRKEGVKRVPAVLDFWRRVNERVPCPWLGVGGERYDVQEVITNSIRHLEAKR